MPKNNTTDANAEKSNAEQANAKIEVKVAVSEKTARQRKLAKLKNKPVQFLKDSVAYGKAQKGVDYTWAKFGSFAIVILASILLVFYFIVIASPRYVSEAQFVVKEAGSQDSSILGLSGLGAVSPGMRDALILQTFLQSREMATALNNSVSLKAHYERRDWDSLSKLSSDSTIEEYVKYYQDHVTIIHDELSDVLMVEVQTFDADYSLSVAQALLTISEKFINDLGAKMANEQMGYAQAEVERSYAILSKNQTDLITFQDKFKLYSPEQQSSALLAAISSIEVQIITEETELKSLLAFMRKGAPEVKAKRIRVTALREQLAQEKQRLTSEDQQSLNKINVDFQEIKLNTELAADLYKSALAGLEIVRAEAYRKLKHLLVIEHPALAQEDKYPRRVHSILTWFIVLLLSYFIGRLILSIIKEHQE
jgi:capsular polysaccharide transport system permease protein